ncbi:MAG: sensor histidine kinase [Candidatus Eiseniibacteriota bacterium]
MRALPFPRRRRTLVLGLVAVLVPLTALLGFQYVWLSRLAKTTAIAHHASLNRFVEAVGEQVRYFYRSTAERTLNFPVSVLVGDDLPGEGARYWASRRAEGVRRLFLVDFSRETYGSFYVYEPDAPELLTAMASEESLAMIAAANAWQVLSYWGGRAEAVEPVVDERDPNHRMVLRPITDAEAHVMGVAGMILDERWFRETLLPRVIEEQLRHFFSAEARGSFSVRVRDGDGAVVVSVGTVTREKAAGELVGGAREGGDESNGDAANGDGDDGADDTATEALPFVFADWTIGLTAHGRTPEELARQSFWVHMTLAGLLVLAVAAGLVAALFAANRAVRLSEMKSDFVSNVSHELRTPLSSIRVFGEFLKAGRADDPETARRYGRHIEAESRRLSRLIDNILEFSRIESGSREYRFAPASLEEIVEAAVEAFRVRSREAGFTIEYDAPEEAMPAVRMDADAIGQVMYNLLDNAVKYSGESRWICVRVAAENGAVTCSVRDKGIGIPRTEQSKVFERFHRAGTSLVHDVKGSGLGLSIVEHVVRAHGGSVSLESEPGVGTVVRVTLPGNGGRGPEAE